MFEEDLRSEQFESNTFKPRYPVFLNDPNLSSNGPNGPSAPPPAAATPSKSLYPMPNVTAVTPSPPVAASYPSAPPDFSHQMPSNPVMPSPSTNINQHNSSITGPNKQSSVEYLGFSLPPDYQPTETDPATNIGWK